MAAVTLRVDEANAVHEAELHVQTSISVREQYKTKLRTLVDALLSPPQCVSPSKLSPAKAATTDASKKKQLRDVIADRQRVRATMPAGKELQVVGDWLLLLRAASVNVVESIAHWREVVHHGRELPYEVDHANYLLCMAHDTDFLDVCEDLVTWLGFRLVRNPFITRDGLETNGNTGLAALETRRTSKKIAGSPPALLVKPLVSILPEDDVVDGSRIASAQSKLIEEEALYGRSSSLDFVEKYFSKAVSPLEIHSDAASNGQNPGDTTNVFEAIVASTKSLRVREHHLMVLQREHSRVVDLTKQFEHQIRLTKHHSEHDLVSDHRVWQYREHCRQETLRTANAWLQQLNSRQEVLVAAVANAQQAVERGRSALEVLVQTRDQARQRKRLEADEQERQQSTIRRKTLERNRDIKAKRAKKTPKATAPQPDSLPITNTGELTIDDLTGDVAQELGMAPSSPVDKRVELDQRRLENLERRKQHRLEHDRIVLEETQELDRRRNENALMFLEDRQSMLLEIRRRHVIHKKIQRERVRKLAAVPIFSTVQHLGGISGGGNDKKFRVAVYDHRAKGYALDGLRFVAYDPSTSSSLSLLLTAREYRSLGYGRTQDGLSAFCQWLCVTYDRRRRQRNLVWSGAPCPPPLRIREYDHALLCVHKEGLQLSRFASSSYHFVAAYVRTSDTSKLHFVVSSVLGADSVREIAVTASQLLPTRSLILRTDYEGGPAYPSWLHDTDASHVSADLATSPSSATRVFSGEMTGLLGRRDNQSTRFHVYEVSQTEYELRFTTPAFRDGITTVSRDVSVVLLKHDVNPYAVRLPHSAFGDLLGNLRLEADGTGESIHAVVLPSWRTCLARYVRAIRMAKFGCKIDGCFHLVVVTLVQQKTEFRAHLLFELAAVGVGLGARQSLRISLSQFLRCPDSMWHPLHSDGCLREQLLECETCLANKHSLENISSGYYPGEDHTHIPEVSGWGEGTCEACSVVQRTRVEIVHMLLERQAEVPPASLEYLYYGVCEACGTLPPPIVVVAPSVPFTSSNAMDSDLETCLGQFFTVFYEDTDLVHAEGIASVRESLDHNRICVVRARFPSILTQSIARDLFERIHRILQAKLCEEQSITIALVAKELDIFQLPGHLEDHHNGSLEEAIQNLAATVVHIDTLEPITIVSEGDEAPDGVFDFETYLVSEALLVEAMRVVLHPEIDWRLPGETVGASSWSTACEFLQHPSQLSATLQLQQQNLVSMSRQTRAVLDAYTAHPKWPATMDSVREPFQPILATILHVVHVQYLLDRGGGLLSSSSDEHNTKRIYELDHHVSVITISSQKGSAGDFGQMRGVY